jgi:hypothetical protein
MQKLLEKYRANPTKENAKRLLDYTRKHPFASILLTPEDQATIEDAIDSITINH